MRILTKCLVILPILWIVSCSSGAKRMNADKDLLSDTGGLTRTEMERAAEEFAIKITTFLKKNPREEGVFLTLRPTKNETSEQIPTDVFNRALERHLLERKVFTVRTSARKMSLEEIKRSQELGTLLEVDLKSPNFFIRTRIDESMFLNSGDKIVEQILNIELVDVGTTLVSWSEKKTYRKKAVSGNGVGW